MIDEDGIFDICDRNGISEVYDRNDISDISDRKDSLSDYLIIYLLEMIETIF